MQVIDKPWGKEEILTVQHNYVVKRLTMLSGKRCIAQYHKSKIETIYVLSGVLLLHLLSVAEISVTNKDSCQLHIVDDNIIALFPGDYYTIMPGISHRMECGPVIESMIEFDRVGAVYLECSTTELDDVVLIGDDYDRN